MKNMKCHNCAMKHLSAAMSYGKEVMSGHGQGAELDHRPDFLGELINAEHHMEFLDNVLFRAITDFRRSLQEEGLNLKPEHIDRLRRLWLAVDKLSSGAKTKDKKGCSTCGSKKKNKEVSERQEKQRLPDGVFDVVIPLWSKDSGRDREELRYALRSIERNLAGYRDVIVVCDNAPDWLQDVKVIDSVPDDSRKNINLFRKRLKAAEDSDADYNIYWCDDYILLNRMEARDIPVLTGGRNLLNYKNDSRVWHQVLRATGEALHKYGRSTIHCEEHIPSVFERSKLIELGNVFKKERELEPGLAVCALYHNYYGSPLYGLDGRKATFESDAGGPGKVKVQCSGKDFLGYNNAGFESGVSEFLQEIFPNKSKYEKQGKES